MQLDFLTYLFLDQVITQKLSGTMDRHCLQKAIELLDECNSDDGSPAKKNYAPVSPSAKLTRTLTADVKGYVINSVKHTWQRDDKNAITPAGVQEFLLSLRGILRAGMSWKTARRSCLSYHLVVVTEGNKYTCDCKAFWIKCECSNIYLAMHLDKVISITSLMQAIPRGKEMGRPLNPVSIYKGCHKLTSEETEEMVADKAANFIGVSVGRRIDANSDRIFIGKITCTRVVPQGKKVKTHTVWTVHYNSQYDGDDSDEEEITFSQLCAGKRLLRTLVADGGLVAPIADHVA